MTEQRLQEFRKFRKRWNRYEQNRKRIWESLTQEEKNAINKPWIDAINNCRKK